MFVYDAYTTIARANTTPRTTSFTCASGVTLLVVGICTGGLTDRTGGAPTYNGVALTQAGSNQEYSSGETVSELWYMLSPPTGSSYTVSVPNSGLVYITVTIASFKSPTGSTPSFINAGGSGNGVSSSFTFSTPSASGNLNDLNVIFVTTGYDYYGSANVTCSHNSVNWIDDGNYGSGLHYGHIEEDGTLQLTFTWGIVTADDYAVCGGVFRYTMPDRISTSVVTAYSVIKPPTGLSVSTLVAYSVITSKDLRVSKLNVYSVLSPPINNISISKVNAYSVLVPSGTVSNVSKAQLYSVVRSPIGSVANVSKAVVYSVIGPQLEVEIELSDSFAFNDRFAIAEELSLTDSFAFNDQISFVHSLDITDSFVFDEAITVDVFKDIQITDSFAFDDSFTIDYTSLLLTFYEEFAFNDYFEFYDYLYFIDDFTFNDSIVTVNENIRFTFTDSFTFDDNTSSIFLITHYLVTWRCRTRTPQWGYGGSQYGSIISYGDGSADDIESFVVDVGYLDTSNVFHRTIPAQVTIPIVDSENPDADAHYVYHPSSSFTFTNNNLTFRVWQKDTNGVLSPCREVQCFPLFLET